MTHTHSLALTQQTHTDTHTTHVYTYVHKQVKVETVDVIRDVERIVTVDVQGPDQPSTSPGPPPV